MRVLLLNDHYALGGAERILDSLRHGLAERGHEVRLLCPDRRSEPDYSCWSSANPLAQVANPFAWQALRRALIDFRPHVVHLHMISFALSPLVLSLLKDVPTMHYLMLYELNCPRGSKWLAQGGVCRERPGLTCLQCLSPQAWLARAARQALVHAWQSHVDCLVPLSQHLKDSLRKDGWSVGPVVPAGVSDPGEPGRDSRPELLFAGRLVAEKGVEVLLEAYARLRSAFPEARLVLCGEGPLKIKAEPGVELAGSLSQQEMARRMAECRLVVVPSIWEEPYGLVAVEAASHGRPCVVFRSGGLSEIVNHEQTGLVVEAGNSRALADALERLWRDEESRQRMAKAARQRFLESFTNNLMVTRMEGLYYETREGYSKRA